MLDLRQGGRASETHPPQVQVPKYRVCSVSRLEFRFSFWLLVGTFYFGTWTLRDPVIQSNPPSGTGQHDMSSLARCDGPNGLD